MGGATADLEEILQASLPDDMAVIIQTGGAKKWQNDLINPRRLERYVYSQGELTLVESQPQASMGAPETLAEFLRFGQEQFPAERQMLIIMGSRRRQRGNCRPGRKIPRPRPGYSRHPPGPLQRLPSGAGKPAL